MDEISETAMTTLNLLHTMALMVFARRRVFLDHGNPHSRTGDIVRHRRICDLPPTLRYATARSLRKMGILQKTQRRSGFSGKFGDQSGALAASRLPRKRFGNRPKRQRVASNSLGSPQTVAPVLDGDAGLHVHRPTGLIAFPFLAFAAAPGFPVAILENAPALAAIERGVIRSAKASRQNCGISRTLVGPGGSGSDRLGFAAIVS